MKYFVPDIRSAVDLAQQASVEDKFGGLPWGLRQDNWPPRARRQEKLSAPARQARLTRDIAGRGLEACRYCIASALTPSGCLSCSVSSEMVGKWPACAEAIAAPSSPCMTTRPCEQATSTRHSSGPNEPPT